MKGDFRSAATKEVDGDTVNEKWFGQLLSSFVLMAARDEIVYAYTDFDSAHPGFKVVVFTKNRVLVATLTIDYDGSPAVQGVGRATLASMKVSTQYPTGQRGEYRHEWPGSLAVVLNYPGLSEPVELIVDGTAASVAHPSEVVGLVESLAADL